MIALLCSVVFGLYSGHDLGEIELRGNLMLYKPSRSVLYLREDKKEKIYEASTGERIVLNLELTSGLLFDSEGRPLGSIQCRRYK